MQLIAIAGTDLAALTAGWLACRRRERRSERRFAREFAELAEQTDLAWNELGGPGPSPEDLAVGVHAARALRPERLTDADYAYYLSSWGNVLGEFGYSTSSALSLAQHLTANLLLNRAVLTPGAHPATELPASWVFPAAQGYRRAQLLARTEQAEYGEHAAHAEALRLFEAFYMELLNLGRHAEADRPG